MLTHLTCATLFVSSVVGKILYAGVAESGGEFGVFSSSATPGTGLPGRFDVDYAFLNEAISQFVDVDKINLFRIAFLMERMVPVENGLGSNFNETHFGFFKDAVDFVTVTKGAYAILDPHNYMRYNDPSQQPNTGSIIGDTTDPAAATTAQFQEFWAELASRFADNEKVIFGINNEPHDMDTSLILANDQAAINGIRSAGATQLIIAPGNGFTGGHSWNQSAGGQPSSDFMFMLQDPLNNTAIDIHEYLDTDFSGSHSACVQSGPANLDFLTSWLQEHGLKAMITEFGGSSNEMCSEFIEQLIDYMAANDEYIGWSAWAAGPLWGVNSACCTDSAQLGSLEPFTFAADGSPSMYDTVWVPSIRPRIPADLKTSGVSSLS
ncbi:endoglucanase 1 [Stereum hirsutum FP-91666 SS1]|uniref:endoglucanase 1 n=1 Tax=Stereum hirsutum (strain FP-91666) TaxID=721885 RepID=UPI000444A396|nr:endoglucanase 1 [Stereum hirsutum FP-91666 SS1]EIM82017.1 endoglucanase 1 [Stereum hirsutum FP-91666 SS1]